MFVRSVMTLPGVVGRWSLFDSMLARAECRMRVYDRRISFKSDSARVEMRVDGHAPRLPWQTIDLEPEVQVGTSETHQALRNTDMHNSIVMIAPRAYG